MLRIIDLFVLGPVALVMVTVFLYLRRTRREDSGPRLWRLFALAYLAGVGMTVVGLAIGLVASRSYPRVSTPVGPVDAFELVDVGVLLAVAGIALSVVVGVVASNVHRLPARWRS